MNGMVLGKSQIGAELLVVKFLPLYFSLYLSPTVFCHPFPVFLFLLHCGLTPFPPGRITFTAAMPWSLRAHLSSRIIKSAAQHRPRSANSCKGVKRTDFM